MQPSGAEELKRLVAAGLADAELDFEEAEAYATPRRLVLVVKGLPEKQPDVREEKRGPRADAPDKAINGFLRANGITLADCERRDTDRGEFLFAVIERNGRATADVLPKILSASIDNMTWPKSMRWGEGKMRWVRPLIRVLCAFDGAAVPLKPAGGVPCGNLTSGHPVHAPEEFDVGYFKDYRAGLYRNKVIVDAAERKRVIMERVTELAEAEGLTPRGDRALLDEVAGLVEWPVTLIGTIDEAYMDLPDEALTTVMRHHQKYFSLVHPDGSLAPRFIVVANVESADGGAAIVAGNERVLRARLADAKFFRDRDRRMKLRDRVASLADITFHDRLGSLADKVARIEALAGKIAAFVPDCDPKAAGEAAHLCKADLTTGMVVEFPELQGIMGRHYALADGAAPEVADAIADHYSPVGPNDVCPTAPVSVALAVADRIDTLVGFWAIGETPTGSRDPFALRRAALGVIRLVLENELRLHLLDSFRKALASIPKIIPAVAGATGHITHFNDRQVDAISSELLKFFAGRLKVHLRDKGVRHDLISAVFALGGEDDLVRLMARVEALRVFLDSDDGANLLTAHKRAGNIVAIEEKKDDADYGGDVQESLFAEAEERELAARLGETREMFGPVLDEERFGDAMAILATLRAPVDAFFDHVTVNCDVLELRANRLRLLSKIRATMSEIADFSRIEG